MAPTEAAVERIDYAATLSDRAKQLIMASVVLGLFLEALDQTIVATALPAIVVQFQGIDLLAWVSTGYLLASTALVPIYGKLSDVLGRRAIIMFGIVVFLLGSMLCGAASSMLLLVIFRCIQGMGAAAIVSTAFAIPADLYPPAERAKATGLIGAAFGTASILGPFVGGFLTDNLSWRWVFFVNIPFGLIALGVILWRMPRLGSDRREPIDWRGTGLLLLAVIPLLLALSLDKTRYAWGSPLIVGLLVIGIVASVALLWAERRAPAPILDLALFRTRTFAITALLAFLTGGAFLPAVLFLPLFLVNVAGVSVTVAGTALIPQTLAVVAMAIISGNIVQRTGRYKPTVVVGLVLTTLGYGLLALMDVHTTTLDVIGRVIVLGLGLGCVVPLWSLIAQNALPYRSTGSASSTIQFSSQMGGVLGTVIFGALFSALLLSQFSTRVEPIAYALPAAQQQELNLDKLRNGSSNATGASSELTFPADILPATADQLRAAVRLAFANSVTTIYAYVTGVMVLGFLITLMLPEIPLRSSNSDEPMAAAH
ncbi:MAG: MDR family MFS transporter [Roseiflexaceae bacterium]|nr:MDR family MFS transporter [Roseiflexaceae bacterium]